MASDALNNLPIAAKNREELATKLARVVEPLTEAEAQATAERDRENDELRNAFSREIELSRQFDSKPTQELRTRLREAQNYTDYVWQESHEKLKKRFDEETRGS
jgi:uncharacterized membrane protein YheB (UPF0754 family)